MQFIKRLLGCDRRAKNNQLRVFAYRIEHAETAEERLRIADDAIQAGVIAEVEVLMDAAPLATHEAIAFRLWREVA